MNLLKESTCKDSRNIGNYIQHCYLNFDEPLRLIKLFVGGQFSVDTGDFRFLLWVNDEDSNYNSFVLQDGSHLKQTMPEWDSAGFYVGRNGWSIDASVSIEYTISAMGNNLVGHGMATFGHDDNAILGYTCNGLLNSNKDITKVALMTTGGVNFIGSMKVYEVG
mgnify:CR=1 FL=1